MKALVIDDHPVIVSALIDILHGMPQGIQAQIAHFVNDALSVKAHLTRLSECLHTSNRTDTVQEAIRLGLVHR